MLPLSNHSVPSSLPALAFPDERTQTSCPVAQESDAKDRVGVMVNVAGNQTKVVPLSEIIDEKSLIDPITREIMSEPTKLYSSENGCGHNLDKKSLYELVMRAKKVGGVVLCPVCRARVEKYAPDLTMKDQIEKWKKLTGKQEESSKEPANILPKTQALPSLVAQALPALAAQALPALADQALTEIDLTHFFSLPPDLHQSIQEIVNLSENDNSEKIVELLLNTNMSSPNNQCINTLLQSILDGKKIKKRPLVGNDRAEVESRVRKRQGELVQNGQPETKRFGSQPSQIGAIFNGISREDSENSIPIPPLPVSNHYQTPPPMTRNYTGAPVVTDSSHHVQSAASPNILQNPNFRCSATRVLLTDPVLLKPCDHNFDKDFIEHLFRQGSAIVPQSCPVCHVPVHSLVKNTPLRDLILRTLKTQQNAQDDSRVFGRLAVVHAPNLNGLPPREEYNTESDDVKTSDLDSDEPCARLDFLPLPLLLEQELLDYNGNNENHE